MGLSGVSCAKRVPSLTEGLDSPTLVIISPRSDLTALLWQQTFSPLLVDLVPIPKCDPISITLHCNPNLCIPSNCLILATTS